MTMYYFTEEEQMEIAGAKNDDLRLVFIASILSRHGYDTLEDDWQVWRNSWNKGWVEFGK